MEIAYHVIVLAVAAFSLIKGWKYGFIRQMGGILGLSFGCVVAHLFCRPASDIIADLHIWPIDNIAASFVNDLIGASLVYALTYCTLWCLGRILAEAMSVLSTGVLDSIFGAIICTTKYLIALSIFFNFAVASNPQSVLMKYACYDDGNIVEGVMLIAPYSLGCQSYWDLAHRIQLKEARKISYNLRHTSGVILMDSAPNINLS
ncbi:MAG: CvpA family protein [Bacteroidales bacterium]|nr:CvpA family protein [Bacteroidales bacterium]MBD5221511.1 CvpA family protein [Bacteroidales bacterium]